ncbi:tRNA pseudouridine(38-40) synthase TruA [Mucilaginibacter sp. HMF5004]|uniref:tRNA pseudouridine(38-40) synthase TruA n=1 Tax=Mucilaginibacter rivuli TaxID=2857527 RepID=UPI001C5EAECD|nr:tRNA pseudouridine(38-40) synthase TruA [Mucilaginibacter rivuli]
MTKTQRYFIEIAFDGTRYHGWQTQPNAITVQEVLDKALSTVLRQAIETVGCGRTDAGVHAKQLFAHFDVMEDGRGKMENVDSVLRSINGLLPIDITAKRLIPVDTEAHARFDATLRSYEYHVHFEKDPFRNNFSWQVRDKPDVELMNRAAQIVMEYTDFSCFSKSNTQVKTNNCKIARAEWALHNDKAIFYISADRFLRNMVRAIVGTLMMVGRKEIEPEEVRQIIESKNRSNAGTSVPACGLYLTEIKYPYL